MSIEIFSAINPEGTDEPDSISHYYTSLADFEGMLDDFISIASDAGNGSVELAFKGEDSGAVYFLDGSELTRIADSFDDFMHMLRNSRYMPEAKARAEKFWKTYLGEE